MKTFNELTRLGRLRRMRPLAQKALEAFGLPDARMKFFRYAGNILYRVNSPDKDLDGSPDQLFVPGQYLLRVHEPRYQTSESICLELEWLSAMRRDADLPVPEPSIAGDGQLLIHVAVPGIPEGHDCSLLKWVRGSMLKNPRPEHYRAQGRLMARMHQYASGWSSPLDGAKKRLDWEGLFRGDTGAGMLASEVYPLLPDEVRIPFEKVAQEAQKVMTGLGTGREVFGLIHADLGVDANLLFWKGEPRAIDFDDSAYGYHLFDLAISLEHVCDIDTFAATRDALLAGYAEVRHLPQEQIEQLDLFLAVVQVYLGLWSQAAGERYPQYWESDLCPRVERAGWIAQKYCSSR